MSRVTPLREATDVSRVGGKAASLGRLMRAGFEVPDGFVIETLPAGTNAVCPDLADAVIRTYEALGGTVAVRSSATAEDHAAASMAGQFETVLNVTGNAAVLGAVRHCLASAASDRVRAYAAEKRIDPSALSMAVVVQRQIDADVAGVMFTAAPDDTHPRQMLIDAAWGLGESVVSGRVQPDVLRVAFDDGRVIAATIARKRTQFTAAGEQPVPEDRQHRPCLTGRDAHRLWQLGRAVEAHFGSPQDTEWAIAGGRLYLLQARPITTHADAAVRSATIDDTRNTLRQRLAAGEGPWVLHNLTETLPHPSPLAWSVVLRFMAGSGAYGTAHRSIGFAPADDMADHGFLDLIGGRIYMDTARAPRMFWADFPFAYDAEVLKRRPDASQQPPTRPTGSPWQRWAAARRLRRVNRKLRGLAGGLDAQLRETFAGMAAFVTTARRDDLSGLTNAELAERWGRVESRVMDQFGPHEILAGLAAGQALDDLQSFLAEHVWDEDPAAVARDLSSGGPADTSMTADAGLYEVGVGRRTLDDWLAAHGHRGVGEFDLASPRWREQPEAARVAAARHAAAGSPAERHAAHAARVSGKLAALRQSIARSAHADLGRLAVAAQRAVALREDAKDTLMLGYDLLRDIALEAGRRFDFGDDVFELHRDELLSTLSTGYAPLQVIDERRGRRIAERRLRWPALLDAAAVDSLGRPDAQTANGPALAVSAGAASGPALVVQSPSEVGDVSRGYVLVCPSTDPSWTPLLAGAAALVVECGGVLSHGAVVAREMGLPAVVLPDATRRFSQGTVLRVDGTRGHVTLASDAVEDETTNVDDAGFGAFGPPPAGRLERRSARAAAFAAVFWVIVLLPFFLLPDRVVRWPAFALIDAAAWPLARGLGWPITVATIAAVTAGLLLVMQRVLTDNRRLLVAKRRSAARPGGAAGVTGRVLVASLVPTALLLGPLVVLFVWLGERATPAARNMPAGSAVRVAAAVDGEWTRPVTLVAPPGVAVDPATPAAQSLPPLRPTLEGLLSLYRRPRPLAAGDAWQLAVAPDPAWKQAGDDLADYLNVGLPPQAVEWVLRPTAAFDGTFAVTVETPGQAKETVAVSLGDRDPPRPTVTPGRAGSPIRSLTIVRPKSVAQQFFFRPFGVEFGWVGVYVGVYVVVLLVLRRLLKVA